MSIAMVDEDDIRLSRVVTPLRYKLDLCPNLVDSTFSGTVEISVVRLFVSFTPNRIVIAPLVLILSYIVI
jgi:hypothetical protein